MRISDRRFALYLMAPAALFLAVFVAYPLFRLVADSFFKISPIAGGPRDFVGLDNYFRAFASEAFMGAGWRTLAYTLVVVTLEFALGLGMALLFTTLGRKSEIWRTVFLYPLMIAPDRRRPAVEIPDDRQLRAHRHPPAPGGNPAEPQPDRLALQPGHRAVLRGHPGHLAHHLLHVPGALRRPPEHPRRPHRGGPARRRQGPNPALFRIILPLLRPVIAVALVVRGIDAARAFDTILIQTNGGPQSASETMSLLIYRTMIRFGDPGLASAMGTIYLLAMLGVAFFAVATIWRPRKGQLMSTAETPINDSFAAEAVAYRRRPAGAVSAIPATGTKASGATAGAAPTGALTVEPATPTSAVSGTGRPRRRKHHAEGLEAGRRSTRTLLWIILAAAMVLYGFPFLYLLFTSFKAPIDTIARAAHHPSQGMDAGELHQRPGPQRSSGLVHQQRPDRHHQHRCCPWSWRFPRRTASPATRHRAAGCSSWPHWSPGWCRRSPSASRWHR